MTNEMKLLMALCDALGFEVEEDRYVTYRGHRIPDTDSAVIKCSRDEISKYEHQLDYKLTKKVSKPVFMEWIGTPYEKGSIVQFPDGNFYEASPVDLSKD